MTNNRSALLITAIALILLALVPAVSANTIIYDEDLYEYIDTSISGVPQVNSAGISGPTTDLNRIVFKNISKAQTLNYLVYEIPTPNSYLVSVTGTWPNGTKIEDGRYDFEYYFNGKERPGVLYLNRKTDSSGNVISAQFTIFLNDWDIGDLTGKQAIVMPFNFYYGGLARGTVNTNTNTYLAIYESSSGYECFYNIPSGITVTESTGIEWKHYLKVLQDVDSYYIDINGYVDGHKYNSVVKLSKDGNIFASIINPGEEIHRTILKSEISLIEIISPSGAEYAYPLYEGISPKARTGSVTMTDYDGTAITGFEVTAVNVYTGRSYTVSTDTNVAHITLPMDRIMTIRNPQTGEYEDAPVGYYRFFASKPGYKMLHEDGVRVTVLPTKYSSYQFCDILVTKGDDNLRTGSVTMTDHNGTRLSDFEVRAVNEFTGESYTIATENDTAVITLPMDQTIRIRDPQTGEYEDAPVGYYRFFGYKPGYKMVHDDGIQVAVMPIKYRPYQFCDITVMSESGYLTGKHQFQLRSLADNSILQTGTISAQSATTGEWVNGTVVNGLATLILPYDTSNPVSQYAGNYYVYGTSPGYLDSQFPAQITVTPATQSQIHTIYLSPVGGIPEPGYVTLRIQAISETGQGVPNANILVEGVEGSGWDFLNTYNASSTGYLEVSVPGNTTYDIRVSAPGYSDSSRRVEVLDTDPELIEITLYLTGYPTQQPTTQPTGWPTGEPTPTSGIPGDDGSEGFLSEAIRGISRAFGVGFATGKTIFGMLLAIAIGFATAKQLRGGAAEFGLGLLGGTMLGVLVGLLPVWTIVVLLLVVGMYIGYRYVGGSNNG